MMKHNLFALSRRYRLALRNCLQQGVEARPALTHRLGRAAVTLGLETLDLARIHEIAVATLVSARGPTAIRSRLTPQADVFFAGANLAIEATHRAGVEPPAHPDRQNRTVTRRTAQLMAANRHLKQGLIRRKAAEVVLRKSGRPKEIVGTRRVGGTVHPLDQPVRA